MRENQTRCRGVEFFKNKGMSSPPTTNVITWPEDVSPVNLREALGGNSVFAEIRNPTAKSVFSTRDQKKRIAVNNDFPGKLNRRTKRSAVPINKKPVIMERLSLGVRFFIINISSKEIIDMVLAEQEKKNIDKLRKMRGCAPEQIECMITAIDNIRTEVCDEVISDAFLVDLDHAPMYLNLHFN